MNQEKLNKAGNELTEDIASAKKVIQSAISAFEKNDLNEAGIKAKEALEGVRHITEKIGDAYSSAVLQNVFPTFESDEDFLEKPSEGQDQKLVDVLIRLQHYIAFLEKEKKRYFPRKTEFKLFSDPKWRKVAIALPIFLVGLLGAKSFHSYTKRDHGLMGEYFTNKNMRGPSKKRRDDKIDFNWGTGAPYFSGPSNSFSVRWTGYLRVPEDGTYQLATRSDDGVRLWLANKLVINNWSRHKVMLDKSTIKLLSGYYPVRLEYYEEGKDAVIQLSWGSENQSKLEVIDPKDLVPSSAHLNPSLPIHTTLE